MFNLTHSEWCKIFSEHANENKHWNHRTPAGAIVCEKLPNIKKMPAVPDECARALRSGQTKLHWTFFALIQERNETEKEIVWGVVAPSLVVSHCSAFQHKTDVDWECSSFFPSATTFTYCRKNQPQEHSKFNESLDGQFSAYPLPKMCLPGILSKIILTSAKSGSGCRKFETFSGYELLVQIYS